MSVKFQNIQLVKKVLFVLLALIAANVSAITHEEKGPVKIKLKERVPKDEGRSSELLGAYENDAQLTLTPFVSISSTIVIISGNGVMDTYTLPFPANQMQVFDISSYHTGNYQLQIILLDGEVLSGEFEIK